MVKRDLPAVPEDAEVLSGEVVQYAPGEATLRDFMESAEAWRASRDVTRAASLDELKLFTDVLDEELRPLVAVADSVADHARFARLAEFYTEGVLGVWISEHVGADAAPLPGVGRITSPRQLPAWFHKTADGRAKRGIRCRRLAQLGPAELLGLFDKAAAQEKALTQTMVNDRWREVFPNEAEEARLRGRRPAMPEPDPAWVLFLADDDELAVWESLRAQGVTVSETEARLHALREEAGGDVEKLAVLLRGAALALGPPSVG